MLNSIAIIGAGPSGLAAASLLARSGFAVEVFEKSRGTGGRAASRSRHGCRYDHGANYFTTGDEEVAAWIHATLPSEGLEQVEGAILPFDRSGGIGVAASGRGGERKWTYRDGISTLGKLMRDHFGLKIRQSTRITALERHGDGWTLHATGGMSFGRFGAVLITTPSPQAWDLVASSAFDEVLKAELLDVLKPVRYQCQFSVLLNFSTSLELRPEAYALINTDGRHAIAWLSDESMKPGRVPADESLFVVQMAPWWSVQREGMDPTEVAGLALSEARGLIGADLPEPQWHDCQWWRFAHPVGDGMTGDTERMESAGLFFAGDGTTGKGRVAEALKSGFEAARSIEASFQH